MSPCDNLGAIGLACGCARRSVAYRWMTRATPMTHRCLPSQMWRACAFDRTTLICQRVLPGLELLSMRVFGLDTTAAFT